MHTIQPTYTSNLYTRSQSCHPFPSSPGPVNAGSPDDRNPPLEPQPENPTKNTSSLHSPPHLPYLEILDETLSILDFRNGTSWDAIEKIGVEPVEGTNWEEAEWIKVSSYDGDGEGSESPEDLDYRDLDLMTDSLVEDEDDEDNDCEDDGDRDDKNFEWKRDGNGNENVNWKDGILQLTPCQGGVEEKSEEKDSDRGCGEDDWGPSRMWDFGMGLGLEKGLGTRLEKEKRVKDGMYQGSIICRGV